MDVRYPPHVGPPYYGLADLAAELDARGLLLLVDEQLVKPILGHRKFAARRHACQILWLESELAVLRSYDAAVAA